MSVKKLNFFGILLLFGHLTNAVVIDCSNLTAAECKTEFSKQFDKESKAFHIAYSIGVLTKCIEEYNALLAELPQDDKHREPVTKKVQEFTALIQSFNTGQENVAETAVLFGGRLDEKFEPDLRDIDVSDDSKLLYNELLEKHTKVIRDYNYQEFPKFCAFILNLWNQLYGSLRQSDLEAYPEYSKLNTAYPVLKETDDAEMLAMAYWSLLQETTNFLELPYFKEFFHEIFRYYKTKIAFHKR